MKSNEPLAILFIVLVVFLISFNSFSARDGYYDDGYDAGREDGFSDGKSYGYKEGYEEGHDAGYDDCEAAMTAELEAQGEELCEYEDISYCVVFVTDNREYHHFTCSKLGDDFWDDFADNAYDIPHAKSLGFTPCSKCCED